MNKKKIKMYFILALSIFLFAISCSLIYMFIDKFLTNSEEITTYSLNILNSSSVPSLLGLEWYWWLLIVLGIIAIIGIIVMIFNDLKFARKERIDFNNRVEEVLSIERMDVIDQKNLGYDPSITIPDRTKILEVGYNPKKDNLLKKEINISNNETNVKSSTNSFSSDNSDNISSNQTDIKTSTNSFSNDNSGNISRNQTDIKTSTNFGNIFESKGENNSNNIIANRPTRLTRPTRNH